MSRTKEIFYIVGPLPYILSRRTNHFVSAESMVLKRTGNNRNREDSYFG
jgi:hypothetical protein